MWEREERGKVGGRKESIECSNYSLNHVLNLGCHWFCFAGLSSTEGLHRANRRGVWNTGELLSYRNLLDPMKGGKVELYKASCKIIIFYIF